MQVRGMQVKGVIFDFGGVICRFPPEERFFEMARYAGAEPAVFVEAFWSNRIAYDRGDLERDAYWNLVAERAEIQLSPEQIEKLSEMDVQLWLDLDPSMLRWIDSLREAGIRTAVLSNLPAELGEYLKLHGQLFHRFDHQTLSYEVRSVKPEAAIYRHCLDGIGTEAQATLFLDDRPDNVRAAEVMGIIGYKFETPGQFVAEGMIERHGLPPLE